MPGVPKRSLISCWCTAEGNSWAGLRDLFSPCSDLVEMASFQSLTTANISLDLACNAVSALCKVSLQKGSCSSAWFTLLCFKRIQNRRIQVTASPFSIWRKALAVLEKYGKEVCKVLIVVNWTSNSRLCIRGSAFNCKGFMRGTALGWTLLGANIGVFSMSRVQGRSNLAMNLEWGWDIRQYNAHCRAIQSILLARRQTLIYPIQVLCTAQGQLQDKETRPKGLPAWQQTRVIWEKFARADLEGERLADPSYAWVAHHAAQ